jgi:ABC-type transport system involved in multi-copper enzyme maturation permease subunit
MLWYKSWLETRWQFLIGLVVLMLSATATVLAYPKVMQLMPLAGTIDAGGELGRRIREGVELARSYRGYIWSQAFRQNLTQMGTVFAALLGSGSPLSQGSRGAVLFTLSLPASRNRLLGIRAAAGLTELLVLAFVPSVLLTVFSPAIGQSYGIGNALVHGVCLFIAGAVFFSLAFLLSTLFSDLWRPWLLACSVALVLALCEPFIPELSRYSIFRVMSGEVYFRSGGLPWLGLLTSAAVSMAMLYVATRNVARQDF